MTLNTGKKGLGEEANTYRKACWLLHFSCLVGLFFLGISLFFLLLLVVFFPKSHSLTLTFFRGFFFWFASCACFFKRHRYFQNKPGGGSLIAMVDFQDSDVVRPKLFV